MRKKKLSLRCGRCFWTAGWRHSSSIDRIEDKHSTDVHQLNSGMVTWITKYPTNFNFDGDIFLFGPQGWAWGASSRQPAAGSQAVAALWRITQRRRTTWEPQWSEAASSVWLCLHWDSASGSLTARRHVHLSDWHTIRSLNAAFPQMRPSCHWEMYLQIHPRWMLHSVALHYLWKNLPAINENGIREFSHMALCSWEKDQWRHSLLELVE